nr:MAG TPA: hypothetical protein [Caudoviricetes sp.]
MAGGDLCGWSRSCAEAERLARSSEQGSAGAPDHHGSAGRAAFASDYRAGRRR